MSIRSHLTAPLFNALTVPALLFSPICSAQAQTPAEKEARVTATIKERLGNTGMDEEGRVTSISMIGDRAGLTAVDFGVFPHLESLTVIGLNRTKKKKISLAPLETLPRGLRCLFIFDSDLDDEQLTKALKNKPSLMWLSLSRTTASDKCLTEIGKLRDLQVLYLDGTRITDKGLKGLVDVPFLFSLNLSDTNVSDAGLAEIQKMQILGNLNLRGTKVTDAGMVQLTGIPWLQKIDVSKTKVTEKGKNVLRQAFPDLRIVD